MQDIAMIDGDLVVTDLGDLAITASDNDDVIQMANNNIMTRLGENIHHPEVGNDVYNKRLKITSSGLAEVESDSKNAILNDTRVSDVYNILAYAGDEQTKLPPETVVVVVPIWLPLAPQLTATTLKVAPASASETVKP
jgi:hypothetical protein